MSRVQLALNVDDLDEAVSFYAKLFGAEPAKRRPGYANFAIAEPPLKLILLENPGQGGSLNHLGVEVPDTAAVDAERPAGRGAGLAPSSERDTTCCYAGRTSSGSRARERRRWRSTPSGDSPTFWGGRRRPELADRGTHTGRWPGRASPWCCGGQRASVRQVGFVA